MLKGSYKYWQKSGCDWLDLWKTFGARYLTLVEAGLSPDIPDSELWAVCQEHEMLLITSNRNARGSDSLEVTMRRLSHNQSLPVLTIADADRVMSDRQYAESAAVKVLEVMLDIDRFLGTRRMYIP